MKVKVFYPLVVLMALSAAGQAWAEGCDRPGSPGEMTECAALRLKAADRELGEVYGELMDSEDKEFTATLKQAQEAWMRWRETEGALAAKTATEADLVEYARMQQQALMTEDRIKDLRGMAGN
jgi:uncharacterized protein YecT (DUF1311 family)